MPQPHKLSLIEAFTSTLLGFILSYALGLIIFPLFGFNVTPSQNMYIVLSYTLLSFCRSYLVRRLFNVL